MYVRIIIIRRTRREHSGARTDIFHQARFTNRSDTPAWLRYNDGASAVFTASASRVFILTYRENASNIRAYTPLNTTGQTEALVHCKHGKHFVRRRANTFVVSNPKRIFVRFDTHIHPIRIRLTPWFSGCLIRLLRQFRSSKERAAVNITAGNRCRTCLRNRSFFSFIPLRRVPPYFVF